MNSLYQTSEYMIKVLESFSVVPTNNAVKDYLLYYKAWYEKGRKSGSFRRTHDLDCVVMGGNLYADTIFSFWAVLKMYLQAHFPEDFKLGARGEPRKNSNTCEMLLANYEKYFNPNGIGKEIHIFAALAQTRANYMLLPDRGMQNRGIYYHDQMPVTLYQCFEGGKYAKYFREMTVEQWVKAQNLTMFFDGEISVNTIKPLDPIPRDDAYWCTGMEEASDMINAYIEILLVRRFN